MKPRIIEEPEEQHADHWEAVEEATELLLENRPQEALAMLRDIIENDPGNPYAYYYTGAAMFEVGRFDTAAVAFQAALRLAPKHLAARVGLSHCLRIEGNPEEAIRQARKALEQRPSDGDSLFALGLAQAASGNRVDAIRSLQAFLRTSPELEVSMEARAMLSKLGVTDDDAGISAPVDVSDEN